MRQIFFKNFLFFSCLVYAFTIAAPVMASTIVSQKKKVEIDSSWHISCRYFYEFKILTRGGVQDIQQFVSHLQNKPEKFEALKIRVIPAGDDTTEKLLNLADISQEKRVKVSYTAKTAFPGFEKLFADFFSISQADFVQKAEYSIKFPDTILFTCRIQQDGARFEKEVADNIFHWSATRIRELDLMITTASSWDHIAQHYQKRYREIGEKGLTAEQIPDFIKNLKGNNAKEKMLPVLDYLNGQMTYKTRKIPEHALVPCPPENILQRKWGDCKDMALLGTILLRKLNVDAFIALEGKNRKAWAFQLPDPFIFNHALIALEVEGKTIYYDYMAANAKYEIGKKNRKVIHIYL